MGETLVFYDGPRVFTCRSLTDQLYLAAWADEGEDSDRWLYVPISNGRLRMVRSGGLALRRAFREPEGGLVYVVTIPHDELEGDDEAAPVLGSEIEEDWLPAEDFTLNLSTATLPAASPLIEVERVARQENRARLRLEVQLPDYARSEAPTRKIGELLISTQMIYDNIGLVLLEEDPPQRGRVPARVAAETASEVVGLSAASFVVEIAANKLDDLLGESTFSQATKRLFNLIHTGPEREALLEELSALRPRGAKSFRSFMQTLQSSGGEITLEAAGASIGALSERLSSERINAFVTVLNNLVPDEVSELRGRMRLFAADLTRKSFGLIDEGDEIVYEGKISERALVQVNHAPLNDRYDVVVSEFAMFDEAVGERKPRYVLEQLVPIEDGVAEPVSTRRTFVDEDAE